MSALEAAGFWIGVHALLLLYLSYRVGPARRKAKVSIGDGGDPELVTAIRTQANFVEYAPMFLVCLVALALVGAGALLIHLFGAVFAFGRIAHLLGFGLGAWSQGRFIGTLTTFVLLLLAALALFFFAFF